MHVLSAILITAYLAGGGIVSVPRAKENGHGAPASKFMASTDKGSTCGAILGAPYYVLTALLSGDHQVPRNCRPVIAPVR
jgi:hypothetical protein